MAPSWFLSLREDVTVSPTAERDLVLSGPDARLTWRELAPAVRAALLRLTPPGDAEARLSESIRSSEPPGALARWYFHLQHLARRGWLLLSVHTDEERLATLVPISPQFVYAPGRCLPDGPCVLSRFAYLRRDGDAMVLESPLSLRGSSCTTRAQRRSSTPCPIREGRTTLPHAFPGWKATKRSGCWACCSPVKWCRWWD